MVLYRSVLPIERRLPTCVFSELGGGGLRWHATGNVAGSTGGRLRGPGLIGPSGAGPLFRGAHGASYTVVSSLGKALSRKNFLGEGESEGGGENRNVRINRGYRFLAGAERAATTVHFAWCERVGRPPNGVPPMSQGAEAVIESPKALL